MVLRLFVQPGEGKHWIVVKRPEPLPANATPSYSVIASTVLAAGYTSYASKFNTRVGLPNGLSIPAIFVRASARAGIWCAATSAAVNWYYHYGFASHLLLAGNVLDEKWKLYEKTDRYTIDDGFLLGAGLGLASSLLLRRMPISWFAKTAGMTNLGAFGGLAASNAYFQYTGERQKSVSALNDWRNRRALEFHWVYWDKLLLSKLSTVAQAYVLCNGIFHASRLPDQALKEPLKYGLGMITKTEIEKDKEDKDKESDDDKETEEDQDQDQKTEKEKEKAVKQNSKVDKSAKIDEQNSENTTTKESKSQPRLPWKPQINPEQSYYRPPEDYTEALKSLTPESISQRIQMLADLEADKNKLLKEAELVAHQVNLKRYDVVHKTWPDEDERQRELKELQLLSIVWNRLRSRADEFDRKIEVGRSLIAHRKAWDSEGDSPALWTRKTEPSEPRIVEEEVLEPRFAVKEFDQIRESILEEVRGFEKKVSESQEGEEKELARTDLDDGRALLRAADRMHFLLEKKVSKASEQRKKNDEQETSSSSSLEEVEQKQKSKETEKGAEKKHQAVAEENKPVNKENESKVKEKKPKGQPGNMEADKP